MTFMDKGIAAAAAALVGAAFVSVVGYKIIKKQNPALIKNVQKSVSGARERASEIFEGARESFRKGFASA